MSDRDVLNSIGVFAHNSVSIKSSRNINPMEIFMEWQSMNSNMFVTKTQMEKGLKLIMLIVENKKLGQDKITSDVIELYHLS